MSIQDNVNVSLAYAAETTFGTPPAAGSAKVMRRVSSSLKTDKGSFASAEVRADQQIADMRHGARGASGGVEGELSTESYDDFLEAALRGTWAAGASASSSEFATGITIADSGDDSVITFAGGGDLIALGFRLGDVVRLTGHDTAANNGVNLRIVGITGTAMTVTPQIAAAPQQSSGWTVAAPGSRLIMGTERRSFAIEQRMPDASVHELFTGVRIGGFNLGVTPTGMTSLSWQMQGVDGLASPTPYYTNPTAAGTTGILSGLDGGLRVAGKERAVVTSLDLSLSLNLSSQPVIGSNTVPEIFYGASVVTGSMGIYIDSTDVLDAFLFEEEIELHTQLESADGSDFMTMIMNRIKISDVSKTIGADGGVIAQVPFQALLPGGTGMDASTLTIQRSNA